MLTPAEQRIGPQWYIVGTRHDGQRVVIGEHRTEREARKRCEAFRVMLEGYAAIDAEYLGAGVCEEETLGLGRPGRVGPPKEHKP